MTNNMTNVQKQSRFSLANLIGIIWSVHILIAALLYPRPLLPADEELRKQQIFKLFSFFIGTLILFINIASLFVMLTRHSWVDAAKVFFIFFTWALIGVIYITFNHLRDIYNLFSALEDEALQSRDQSVMLIRAGQAALQAGNRKLFPEEEIDFSFSSLLRKIGPLALLFLRKEKNILHIGIETFKLFFVGTRMFKNLF